MSQVGKRRGYPRIRCILFVVSILGILGVRHRTASRGLIAQEPEPARIDFSTYFGGSGRLGDLAYDLVVDRSGRTYVVGSTQSSDLPIVEGLQRSNRGGFDVFVAGFAADGSLIFSTYLGGSGDDYGLAIAMDGTGDLYITGETQSRDFPTIGGFQLASGGITCTTQRELCGDAFLARISPLSGRLVFSTYLGGRSGDMGTGVAVDFERGDRVIVVGATESSDFPTQSAVQPERAGDVDAFVISVSSSGSEMPMGSYLGGRGADRALDLALLPEGQVLVAGWTDSLDFPLVAASQATIGGEADAFLTRIDLEASGFVFSSYFGGTGVDQAQAIEAGPRGVAFVVGTTDSSDLELVAPLQAGLAGRKDAFLLGIDTDNGEQVFGSYHGGTLDDEGLDVAIDAGGNVYLAGRSFSTDFPTERAPQPGHGGAGAPDAFVSYLDHRLDRFLFRTLLGGQRVDAAEGLALDPQGDVVVAGYTRSEDFPIRNPAQPANAGGNADAFVTHLVGGGGEQVSPTKPAPTVTPGPSPSPAPSSTACAGDPPRVNPLTSPTDKSSQTITGSGRPLTDIGGDHTIRLCSDEAGCFYAKTRQGFIWEVEVAVLPDRVNRYTAYQSSRACSYVASTRVDNGGKLLDIEHRGQTQVDVYLPYTQRVLSR